jgi:uracil-DNA glycosylase
MKDSWSEIEGLNIESTLQKVNNEREKFKDVAEIYPPEKDIFRCFSYFDVKDTRVVIIGQDPYHGPNQACGLAFAVNDGIKKPPSLKNIEKELGKEINIESWAEQGVLMLNTSLTVRQSSPGDKVHVNIWKEFTKSIINHINSTCDGVVFVAWGAFAVDFLKDVNTEKHHLCITSHPSPLGAYKKLKEYPAFIGSKVFEQINEKLKTKIIW